MTDQYTSVILEEMSAKFDAVMEILLPMQEKVNQILPIQEDIREMKTDIKTMKAALRATNTDVRRHDKQLIDQGNRLQSLEISA